MQQYPDKAALLQMARSQAGQQLLAHLKQNGGSELSAAIELASAGKFEEAKSSLASLLANPETQQLLKQLEGTHG